MLVLHYHPFASYCQKALVALYELDLPFERHLVEGEEGREELVRLWPMGGIPVLVDDDAGRVLPESSIVIEYLDAVVARRSLLVPADPAASLEVRRWDRFLDTYVANRMQTIVGDLLRPEGDRDPVGVQAARATLDTAYGVLEQQLAGRDGWVAGHTFSLADCGAGPALFYTRAVHRWDPDACPAITAYYRRLLGRPSFARVVEEARPYRGLFPHPWPADMDALDPA
jgi:glutathione S-transferase